MSRDFTSWADTIGLWVFLCLLVIMALLIINPITLGRMIGQVIGFFS